MRASGGKHHGFSPMRGNWKASTAISSPRDEPTDLSVEASREEVDCVSTPPLFVETEVLRIELEIPRVLPPPAKQISSTVLDPRAMDCPERDPELVGDSPQPVSHFGEES